MQIKKLIQAVSLFSAVAAGAAIATSAASARAAAVSAVDCQIETDYVGDYYVTELGIGNQSAGVGARARTVHCDGSGPRAATGAVYIDGIDGSNGYNYYDNVLARVCMISFSGTSATCSQMTNITSGTYTGVNAAGGPASLDAEDLGVLRDATRASWYSQILVTLPAVAGGKSHFYGMTY